MLLVEGLNRAGKNPTRNSLVKGLESFNEWKSDTFPPITNSRNDHAWVDKVKVVQMQNGEQVVISDWLE